MECWSFVLVAYVRIAFRLPGRERCRDELEFSSPHKEFIEGLTVSGSEPGRYFPIPSMSRRNF
jgi:hypothetical protein